MEEIYTRVRWLEFAQPGQTTEELASSFDTIDMVRDPFRAFKTHATPPAFPFRKDCKYIVVVRNPCDALASFYPFVLAHTEEFCAAYGVPPLSFPNFDAFYEGFAKPGGFADRQLFGFLKAWWPHRQEPNVLMLHFANMLKDHVGTLKQVQSFLGLSNSEEAFNKVVELTSFQYMKAHGTKYEAKTIGPCPIMNDGAMVRNGSIGSAKADGMTAAHEEELLATGKKVLGDNAILKWFYEGGEMPIDVDLQH